MNKKLRGWILAVAGLLVTGQAMAATPIVLPKGAKAGVYFAYDGLKSSGNIVENACLTYDGNGGWTSEEPLSLEIGRTDADFYVYVPYMADIKDPTSLYFTLQTDQSTAEAQAASDFLYGRVYQDTRNDNPQVSLHHMFARIVIHLQPGEGMTADELKNGDLDVRIKDVGYQTKINLIENEVQAMGGAESIRTLNEGDLTYSAIIPQQEVKKLAVVWNNTEYTVDFNRYCNKQGLYDVTVTLKKTAGGMSISIGGWEDSGEDFGGTVN